MGYILKNTSGLINTVLTDAGRRAMSKGLFDIAYFQVGDSEVCYDCVDGDISTFNVLQAEYNVQNNTPVPQKNKSEINIETSGIAKAHFLFFTHSAPLNKAIAI